MKLTDIIALAKQGYTPSDIKELIAITENAAPDTIPEAEPQPATIETVPGEASPDPNIGSPEPAPAEIDYKKLYEEMTSEMDSIKTQLREAQSANRSASINTSNDTPVDILKKFFEE